MSETNTALTPYDTGERLEPQPWPLTSDDHYGLVDFDNDESATVFTIVGKSRDDGSPGYLLSVSRYSDDSTVEIDGDRAVQITEELLAGFRELAEWAHRGWEDFGHQARTTRDYSPADIAEARDRYTAARRAARALTDIKETS